ncbi:histidine phosphatase family protein [Streptomyces sp. NPDC058534]|uniref:histidine phosphatase family protein n=1 Tax=Streptomyces sp. NPDC058534 TaxID=3346541 RepID=UPI00365CFD7D
MRIVLLRHGETDRNTTGRFQGQADIPLNDAGVRQAQESARELRPGGWSAVYSSPLARAAQTAAYAAGRLDVPHQRLAGLRERDLGVLDGQDRAEYARRQPHTMRRLLTDPGYAPPGGETGRAALSRFVTALCAIAEPEARRGTDVDAGTAASRTVLAVTHGGVLNLLTSALTRTGGSPGAMVGTCAAACVDIDWTSTGRPRAALRRWNATPHMCAEVPAATPALPFVDLDPLVSDAVNPMEVTRT